MLSLCNGYESITRKMASLLVWNNRVVIAVISISNVHIFEYNNHVVKNIVNISCSSVITSTALHYNSNTNQLQVYYSTNNNIKCSWFDIDKPNSVHSKTVITSDSIIDNITILNELIIYCSNHCSMCYNEIEDMSDCQDNNDNSKTIPKLLPFTSPIGNPHKLRIKEDTYIKSINRISPSCSNLIIVDQSNITGLSHINWMELEASPKKQMKYRWSLNIPAVDSFAIATMYNTSICELPPYLQLGFIYYNELLIVVDSDGIVMKLALKQLPLFRAIVVTNATAKEAGQNSTITLLGSAANGKFYELNLSISGSNDSNNDIKLISCSQRVVRLAIDRTLLEGPRLVPYCDTMLHIPMRVASKQQSASSLLLGISNDFGLHLLADVTSALSDNNVISLPHVTAQASKLLNRASKFNTIIPFKDYGPVGASQKAIGYCSAGEHCCSPYSALHLLNYHMPCAFSIRNSTPLDIMSPQNDDNTDCSAGRSSDHYSVAAVHWYTSHSFNGCEVSDLILFSSSITDQSALFCHTRAYNNSGTAEASTGGLLEGVASMQPILQAADEDPSDSSICYIPSRFLEDESTVAFLRTKSLAIQITRSNLYIVDPNTMAASTDGKPVVDYKANLTSLLNQSNVTNVELAPFSLSTDDAPSVPSLFLAEMATCFWNHNIIAVTDNVVLVVLQVKLEHEVDAAARGALRSSHKGGISGISIDVIQVLRFSDDIAAISTSENDASSLSYDPQPILLASVWANDMNDTMDINVLELSETGVLKHLHNLKHSTNNLQHEYYENSQTVSNSRPRSEAAIVRHLTAFSINNNSNNGKQYGIVAATLDGVVQCYTLQLPNKSSSSGESANSFSSLLERKLSLSDSVIKSIAPLPPINSRAGDDSVEKAVIIVSRTECYYLTYANCGSLKTDSPNPWRCSVVLSNTMSDVVPLKYVCDVDSIVEAHKATIVYSPDATVTVNEAPVRSETFRALPFLWVDNCSPHQSTPRLCYGHFEQSTQLNKTITQLPTVVKSSVLPGRIVSVSYNTTLNLCAVLWSIGSIDKGAGDITAGEVLISGCRGVRAGGVRLYDLSTLAVVWSKSIDCISQDNNTNSNDVRKCILGAEVLTEKASKSSTAWAIALVQCTYKRNEINIRKRNVPRFTEYFPCQINVSTISPPVSSQQSNTVISKGSCEINCLDEALAREHQGSQQTNQSNADSGNSGDDADLGNAQQETTSAVRPADAPRESVDNQPPRIDTEDVAGKLLIERIGDSDVAALLPNKVIHVVGWKEAGGKFKELNSTRKRHFKFSSLAHCTVGTKGCGPAIAMRTASPSVILVSLLSRGIEVYNFTSSELTDAAEHSIELMHIVEEPVGLWTDLYTTARTTLGSDFKSLDVKVAFIAIDRLTESKERSQFLTGEVTVPCEHSSNMSAASASHACHWKLVEHKTIASSLSTDFHYIASWFPNLMTNSGSVPIIAFDQDGNSYNANIQYG